MKQFIKHYNVGYSTKRKLVKQDAKLTDKQDRHKSLELDDIFTCGIIIKLAVKFHGCKFYNILMN